MKKMNFVEIIDSQIKDNEVEFNVLIKILGEDDVSTIKKVATLIKTELSARIFNIPF